MAGTSAFESTGSITIPLTLAATSSWTSAIWACAVLGEGPTILSENPSFAAAACAPLRSGSSTGFVRSSRISARLTFEAAACRWAAGFALAVVASTASAASAATAEPSPSGPRRGLLTLDMSLLSSDGSGEVRMHWCVETRLSTDGCLPSAGEEPVDRHRRDHDEPTDDG